MNEVVAAWDMPAPDASVFSYEGWTPHQVKVAQNVASTISRVYQRSIQVVGQQLLEAKEALPHGAFTPWAEQVLGIPARSARNYMQAAKWLEGKPATVAALPPTVIYEISAPNASPEVVDEVLTAVTNDKPVNAMEVKNKLALARQEQADLRQGQKRKPTLTLAELRVKKARRQRETEAQNAKWKAEAEREREDSQKRLEPLVQSVADAIGPELRKSMLVAFEQRPDFHRFLELLRTELEVRA